MRGKVRLESDVKTSFGNDVSDMCLTFSDFGEMGL